MSDRLFFSLAALAAAALVALALAWPQGLGSRSVFPFGHETAAVQAEREAKEAKQAPKSSSITLTDDAAEARLKGGL